MTWDFFISHASEDKEEVARPLAKLIEEQGLSVWLDQDHLVAGDSIRRNLDEALSQSRWAIVILSPDFLKKFWTQQELNALISREEDGTKVILPVWHRITQDELRTTSPLLASRLGINTSEGLGAVCAGILQAIGINEKTQGRDKAQPSHFQQFLTMPGETDRLRRMAQTMLGEQVGRYRLEKFLGAGGTGWVFLATHLLVGTRVALKLFYPVLGEYSLLTKATERAVLGITGLRHDSIARLLDFGYLSKGDVFCPYISYEYVEGRRLDIWTQDLTGQSDARERRVKVAIEITDALESAHTCSYVDDLGFQQTGVLHGDIKPENIIVRSNDIPKIVDFTQPDLQRLLIGYTPQTRRSYRNRMIGARADHSSMFFGTPEYMPPEQALDGTVLRASDVFALGRTFLELFCEELCEEPRLPADSFIRENLEKLKNSRPAGESNLGLTKSDHVSTAIMSLIECMTKESLAKRIHSMKEVTVQLRSIQEELSKRKNGSLLHWLRRLRTKVFV